MNLQEKMIKRSLARRIHTALQQNPAVVILGLRQVGKTTLALHQIEQREKEVLYLDLERPSDALKLEDAEFFLGNHREKLVIIDEVQHKPDLFPILRSLIDEYRVPGRFVLLGAASEALIGMSSESLAGRVSYLELHLFSIAEVPPPDWSRLWLRVVIHRLTLPATMNKPLIGLAISCVPTLNVKWGLPGCEPPPWNFPCF